MRGLLIVALVAGCHGVHAVPTGQCGYTTVPGTCELRSDDEVASNTDDPKLTAVRATYAWVGALPERASQREVSVDWVVPRSRSTAAHGHAAKYPRVACSYAIANGPCPPTLHLDDGLPPPPGPTADDRDAICARDATPFNEGVVGLEPVELEASFGNEWNDWHRESMDVGVSDSWASGASAVYVRDGKHVEVVVVDMIHACIGLADSTDTLLDTEDILDRDVTRQRVWSATSAVLVWNRVERRAHLVMWIGDRCRITVESRDLEDPWALGVVGQVLDASRLGRVCAKR